MIRGGGRVGCGFHSYSHVEADLPEFKKYFPSTAFFDASECDQLAILEFPTDYFMATRGKKPVLLLDTENNIWQETQMGCMNLPDKTPVSRRVALNAAAAATTIDPASCTFALRKFLALGVEIFETE